MKENKNGDVYATSDLYLSAFLKAKGMKLIDKHRVKGKVQFIFTDREDRKKLIQGYFNNGSINVTSFRNALQDLKTIIFNI